MFMRDGNSAATTATSTIPGTAGTDSLIPWGGPFPQGGLMVWCDGTVRLVSYSVTQTGGNATCFGSYLTPTNGEPATLPD
jgi:hypothetical protein